ncbi:MAG: TRAP transporter small permease [Bacillota bacterium]
MSKETLYHRVDRTLNRILEFVVMILFIIMVILVFAQVYTRFLTNNSLTWSEELSRFIMIWMVFLASSLTYKKRAHITVENIVNLLSPPAKSVARKIAHVLMLIFVIIIFWGAYMILPTVSMQKSPANNIVMAYVYAVIPLSMLLIVPEIIKGFFETTVTKGDENP